MAFFLVAFMSLVIVAVVVLASEIDINQARRIESQVAREATRIRRKTLRGWSVERVARRYPEISIEQIHRVQREMARNIAAEQEIRLLQTLWSMTSAGAEYNQ